MSLNIKNEQRIFFKIGIYMGRSSFPDWNYSNDKIWRNCIKGQNIWPSSDKQLMQTFYCHYKLFMLFIQIFLMTEILNTPKQDSIHIWRQLPILFVPYPPPTPSKNVVAGMVRINFPHLVGNSCEIWTLKFLLPKGSSNIFKTSGNISRYFKWRHLIIYSYYALTKKNLLNTQNLPTKYQAVFGR